MPHLARGGQREVIRRPQGLCLPCIQALGIASHGVGETHEFAVPTDRLRFFDAEYGTRAAPVRIGG